MDDCKMKSRLLIAVFAAVLCLPAVGGGKSKPYQGKVHAIPGLIEAEHYDEGKPGVAYSDVDEKNRGADYREPTQVDIEKRSDASNGHGIGWTKRGEWIVYTVELKEPGVYEIEMPVASKKKGGVFHIEFNDKDITGPISVPDTGSWQKLKMLKHRTKRIAYKGPFLMKVVMDSEGPSKSIADIDYFKFTKVK